MQRFAAFIVFVVFINASPALRQLYKIPLLFIHYQKHCLKTPGISFLHYLKLHYQYEDDNGKDEKEDRQLPLKSTTDAVAWLYCQNEKKIEPGILPYIKSEKTAVYNNYLLPGFLHPVFHPPSLYQPFSSTG